jgi:murein L,D-transpeptidase YcbB/YkuD
VPASIVRSDLYPKFRSDPAYFKRRNFRVYAAGSTEPIAPGTVVSRGLTPNQVRLVQQPGPSNSLGRIRIDMPNAQSVFLHDTPIPRLFGWPGRLFSAGCVRVARVVELAAWLIDDTSRGNLQPISSALRQSDPVNFRLSRKVPVHFVYLAAWVDASGRVQFRPDVYGRFSKGVPNT